MKLLLMCLAALSFAEPAFPQCAGTLTITCPAGSTNLESTIQNAPPGSVVRLDAGTYPISDGIFMANGNVKIVGAGKRQTIIQMTTNGGDVHGISLGAGGIELSGFTLTRTYRDHTGEGSGIVSFQGIQKIENIIVERFAWGIYVRDNPFSIQIIDCGVTGNGNGIAFDNNQNCHVTVTGTDIYGNFGYGLKVFGSTLLGANFRIEKNNISVNGLSGIRLESGMGITISNNFFESNEWRDSANEAQSLDAHIEFAETDAAADHQINHVGLTDNFFGLFHNGVAQTVGAVVATTTKRNNQAIYKDVRPWRFIDTPLYDASTQNGTTIYQNNNYYLPYDYPTLPAGIPTWDRHFCTNNSTCF